MPQNGRAAAPPYVSFKTFLGFLEWLEGIVIPNRLDRSFWGERLSGASGTQLMSALRFLDLIDINNRPRSRLEDLANNPGKRKAILREHLPKCYASALRDLNLDRASLGELEERFRTYSIDGDTLRKALAFFINAYDYSNIPLSPHLTKKTRTTKKASEARKRTQLARKRPPEKDLLQEERTTQDQTPKYNLHPSIHGLLADLVKSGNKWTKEERDRWVSTFVTTIEYAYPVKAIQLDMKWP